MAFNLYWVLLLVRQFICMFFSCLLFPTATLSNIPQAPQTPNSYHLLVSLSASQHAFSRLKPFPPPPQDSYCTILASLASQRIIFLSIIKPLAHPSYFLFSLISSAFEHTLVSFIKKYKWTKQKTMKNHIYLSLHPLPTWHHSIAPIFSHSNLSKAVVQSCFPSAHAHRPHTQASLGSDACSRHSKAAAPPRHCSHLTAKSCLQLTAAWPLLSISFSKYFLALFPWHHNISIYLLPVHSSSVSLADASSSVHLLKTSVSKDHAVKTLHVLFEQLDQFPLFAFPPSGWWLSKLHLSFRSFSLALVLHI